MAAAATPPLSPTRRAWLEHLAKNGPTGWSAMPKNARGRAINRRTWLPLVEFGWCESAWQREPVFDIIFTITIAGRAAIAAPPAEPAP